MKAYLPIIIFGGFLILTLLVFIVFRNREAEEEPDGDSRDNPVEEDQHNG